MTRRSFALVASDTPDACEAKARLEARYPTAGLDEAGVIDALGCDRLMLETLRRFIERSAHIYGMQCGTSRFMMNPFGAGGLTDCLASAHQVTLHPIHLHP